MVSIRKQDRSFIFEVKGMHKLWALKSEISIPQENIVSVRPGDESDIAGPLGLRAPGTHLPGFITAGSYYFTKDGTIFCDVSNPAKSIVVELKDEHYKKLIVEVDDVQGAIDMLKN